MNAKEEADLHWHTYQPSGCNIPECDVCRSRRALVQGRASNIGGAESSLHLAIPMILHCPNPKCGERHIDRGEFATKPHHTHACQHCGFVWRPAIIPTVGVQFLPGFKD